jgi:hypothetical protein
VIQKDLRKTQFSKRFKKISTLEVRKTLSWELQEAGNDELTLRGSVSQSELLCQNTSTSFALILPVAQANTFISL